MKWILWIRILKNLEILVICPPTGMELEEGGALRLGLTTPDVEADGPLFGGPAEGLAIVVTTEDAVTTLTTGAKEATQMVRIVGTNVTDTLWI